MQQDYFGEELRSGDTAVRTVFSRLEPCIITRVTDKAVYIVSTGYKWNSNDRKFDRFWREQRIYNTNNFIKTDKVFISNEEWEFYNKLKENKKIKHEECVFS